MNTKLLLPALMCLQFLTSFGQDRFWVHKPFYENFFNTSPELSEWNLVEDNGTGGFSLSGSGTAVLKMDDAGGNFANRIFSINGGVNRYLPLDSILGRLEINILKTTGGNQRFFVQAQTFTASNVYINQINILPATVGNGFFSINMKGLGWPSNADKIRFIIGGANFSGQQGTIEFDYMSYSNTNGTWNNSANWSVTSGGPGGASIPGANSKAIFDGAASTNGSCQIDAPVPVKGIVIGNGYTGNIDLLTFPVTIGTEGFVMSGGGFTGNQGNATINGNLTVTAGTFKSSRNNTIISGNVAISGGNVNFNQGTLTLNGASDQFISLPPAAYVHRLLVDKNSTLSLNSQLTIQDSLVITAGIINTGNDTIYIRVSSVNPGIIVQDGAGYIDGQVKKWVSSAGTISVPFGGVNFAAPAKLEVSTPPATAGYLAIAYHDSGSTSFPVSFTDGPTAISKRSKSVWAFSTSGISGGSYNLFLSTNTLNYNGLLSDLHLVMASGVSGNHVEATGTVSNPTVIRTGLSSTALASNHYIGITAAALPVTWLNFSGFTSAQVPATLRWEISEYGVNKFEIQRSSDNLTFRTIGVKKSSGQGVNKYTFSDKDLLTAAYYRIKSIDIDGKSGFSPIVSITPVTGKMFVVKNSIFRNEINVIIPNLGNTPVLQLTDMQGRLLFKEKITRNSFIIPAAHLRKGFYNLTLYYHGETITKRIFKE